jgi:DNA/RNA endonuclease G (NUC1)
MKRCGYASLLIVIPLFIFSSCKCEAQIVKGVKGSTVINHTGYTVSFNSATKIPNWVAYELTAEEALGTVKRIMGIILILT